MTEPFHFPDGRVANNAEDLLKLCEQYPDDATSFLVRQDLEKWLAYIGDYDIAECAANARQIELGDRQKLEDFLNKCHSLTAPQPVPSAVTETNIEENIEENLSVPKSVSTTIESSPELITNANVAESEALEAAETSLAEAIPPKKPESDQSAVKTSNSNATNNEEKPSFFQVVAKFIVNILYRNKA
jgi:ATP phosphoribosyltransferase regulatory subunit HisZ